MNMKATCIWSYKGQAVVYEYHRYLLLLFTYKLLFMSVRYEYSSLLLFADDILSKLQWEKKVSSDLKEIYRR